MARRPLIAGNWKMHKITWRSIQLTQKLAWSLTSEDTDAVEVAVCPPFTALRAVGTLIEGDKLPIALGAQDCHPELGRLHRRDLGADAGQAGRPVRDRRPLRAPPVRGRGRRPDQPQARAVLGAGMQPIVCVGEVLEEREAGRTAEVVQGQVRGSWLASAGTRSPAWSSPTSRSGPSGPAGPPPTTPRGDRRHPGHRRRPGRPGRRRRAPHQYSGSVKSSNGEELAGKPDVDGALVGGAGLDADEFALIVKGSARRAR